MHLRSFRLVLALLSIPCLAQASSPSPDAPTAAAAQDQAEGVDAQAQFEEALASSAQARVEDIWKQVALLTSTAPGSGDWAALARGALTRTDLASGSVLCAVATALAGTDPDVEGALQALERLLRENPAALREDHAAGAAGLLADEHMRTLDGAARARALELALELSSDAARPAAVRAEAAVALYMHGDSGQRRKARRILEEFLKSRDPELRGVGALALARTGAELREDLLEELTLLARLPGERGQLAASFLAAQAEREKNDRKLRNLARGSGEAPRADAQAASVEVQLRSILRIVSAWHLEGDKADAGDLFDAAMDGLLGSLDEHSTYFSPKEYARFEQDLGAYYGGIGAYVGEDNEDRLFTITRPIYSGPAYRAGLMSDDKIVRIGDWSTLGKPVEEIIKRLKGRPGTTVRIYVWRRGMEASLIDRPSEDMAVDIVRESITIPSVQWQILPGEIAVVALNDFSQVAAQELRGPLRAMLQQGVKGIVLDLRNNSGGLLDQAGEVASLFLPKGSLVVRTVSRARPDEELYTELDPIIPAEVPMAVLQNRFTASAAEIVAGALQDYDRALLVGERSFGKGSVQNLIVVEGLADDEYDDENKNRRHDNWERITRDWNGNGEFDFAPRLKLTISRYLLPSGRSIHRELDDEGNLVQAGGIEPDLVVKSRNLQTWRLEEMVRLRATHAPRDYVDGLVASMAERPAELEALLARLADNDNRDPSQYPGFEEFYQSLGTPLPPGDVRYLVRMEIRRRVQDARSKEFPPGDFVEDAQLQEAIRALLAKLGKSPLDVPAYSAAIPQESSARAPLAMAERDRLVEIRGAIERARATGAQLTSEQLRDLDDLLSRQLDR